MAEDVNAMFEHELKRLEKRVDALVQVCDQLQDENRSLKQRQDSLTAERASLLQKNEQVRARPLEAQSEEFRNLEFFLSYMSNGLELNGPASRR